MTSDTDKIKFLLIVLCLSYLQEFFFHQLNGLSNLLWVCLNCCELCPICRDLKLCFVQPNISCSNPPSPTGLIFWSPTYPCLPVALKKINLIFTFCYLFFRIPLEVFLWQLLNPLCHLAEVQKYFNVLNNCFAPNFSIKQ